MRLYDYVEDNEGDKATVLALLPEEPKYVLVEWDCNPGRPARMHEGQLTNLSEIVREKEREKSMIENKLGTKISTEEINGCKVDVHVGQNGSFYLYDDKGEQLTISNTLADARENAAKKLKRTKVRIKVPFFTRAGVQGVAIGVHASTSKILARIDGEAVQLSHYERPLKADTPPSDLHRLREINEQTRELASEQQALIRKNEFKLIDEVEKAINEANGELTISVS